MEETIKKYAQRIEKNEVNPHFKYDGSSSGLILDPLREDIPLEVIGFGIYQIKSNVIIKETKEKEVVLVPQNGEFQADVNGKKFFIKREDGPLPKNPKESSASALYVPRNSKLTIQGRGEIAFFEAPALKDNPPFFLSNNEVRVESRGEWVWRRDVTNLINPKNASSNLIVGETYSPPGFWSGTPIHKHDKEQPSEGESDHEEIYFFRFRKRKDKEDQFGPYGVQILMDEGCLRKAYLIEDKSIFAIPGGCHPVVASPVSDLLYLWGLAGRGNTLMMRDVGEFIYLKYYEEIFHQIDKEGRKRVVSKMEFQNLCNHYPFTDDQKRLLMVMLKEKGIELE